MENDKEKLEGAIAALEAQRDTLGDEVVDAAVGPMREKLAALNHSGEPEQQRKLVTLLFMDIAGHTALIRELDPEENMEIIDHALARLAEPIRQHGGHIARYQGDGFKAVFGLPTAEEDDPERAVRAGLAIQVTAQEIAAELEKARRMPGFRVRVGIDTGLVVAGGLTEGEDTIKGMTVNLAARLESAAQPGSVLISHNTYRHIRGVFDVKPLDPIQVKGFDEPVQVYMVLRAKPRAFRMPTRGIEGLETRMVGRQSELQQLQEIYLVALEESQTQVVTVVGDPGIGKSRLLYEFEQWAELRQERVRVFRGRAMPHASSMPYGLLRSLFAFRFNILENDTLEMVHQKLESGLGEFLEAEPALKAHFIGALLGYDFSRSPYLAGLGESSKQILEQALFYLGQFLTAMAQHSLVLFLLEDIHWADNASLDAVQRIAREHPHLRLMVVALARPVLFDQRPYWGQGEIYHTRLDLKPLTQRTCRQLVREVLKKVHDLPEALQELIVDNAEGNPFYVEELVKILIEEGVVIKDELQENWQVDPSRLPDLHVPPTLVAVLQARLDSLPEAERTVLQQASVVGRIFWDAVLRVLQDNERPPVPALSSLAQRELIYHREGTAFAGTEEFIIKHALLRDVVYESVLKRARLEYHQKIAAWLVEASQASGRSDEYAALIAGHYEQASEAQAAAEWYIRAGERAKNQDAPQEALFLFGQALQLLPISEREHRWHALLGQNSTLTILGEIEARRQNQSQILALAHEENNALWMAEAYHRQGFLLTDTGDYDGAVSAFKTSIAAGRRTSDRTQIADTLGLLSSTLARIGEISEAQKRAEEALETLRGNEESIVTARVLVNIANTNSIGGDLVRALQLTRQAVDICQRHNHRFGEAISIGNLGYEYLITGQIEQARTYLERSDVLWKAIGNFRDQVFNSLNLALAYWRSGEIPAAHSLLETVIAQLRKMEDMFGYAVGRSYLGVIQESEGEFDQARQNFLAAKEVFQKIQVFAYANDSLAGLARCVLNSSMIEALPLASELWDYLCQHGPKGMEFPVWAYLTCVRVFEAAQDTARAGEALQAGYNSLMSQANKISDEAWRQSFLQNIAENAEIVLRWKKAQKGN